MKRKVHSDARNVDWTIRLIWTPTAIRPISPKQIYEGSVTPTWGSGFLVMPVSLLVFLVCVIPVMLVVLPLRYARVLPWTIEAIAHPWGKRGGPPQLLRWHVKGRGEEIKHAMDEIAAALERGETRTEIPGATRVSSRG